MSVLGPETSSVEISGQGIVSRSQILAFGMTWMTKAMDNGCSWPFWGRSRRSNSFLMSFCNSGNRFLIFLNFDICWFHQSELRLCWSGWSLAILMCFRCGKPLPPCCAWHVTTSRRWELENPKGMMEELWGNQKGFQTMEHLPFDPYDAYKYDDVAGPIRLSVKEMYGNCVVQLVHEI